MAFNKAKEERKWKQWKEKEEALLLARAIQLFMPGKPQIWYLDLFAGTNDYEAVKAAKAGGHKEINRTNLTLTELKERLTWNVVLKQLEMLQFRNTFPAFGYHSRLSVESKGAGMVFTWEKDGYVAELDVDFTDMSFSITAKERGTQTGTNILSR